MINSKSRKARRGASVSVKDFKRFQIRRKKTNELKENLKEMFFIVFSAGAFYVFIWLFYACCYAYNLS